MKNFNTLKKSILAISITSIAVFSACKKDNKENPNDPNGPNAPYVMPLTRQTVLDRLGNQTLKLSDISDANDKSLITRYPKEDLDKISSCILGETITFNLGTDMPRSNATACDEKDKKETMWSWSVSMAGDSIKINKNFVSEKYKIVKILRDDKQKVFYTKLQLTDATGKIMVKTYTKVY